MTVTDLSASGRRHSCIWGVHDGIFPRDEQDRLVASYPGARLVVHETSGHAVNWEFPEWTMREILGVAG